MQNFVNAEGTQPQCRQQAKHDHIPGIFKIELNSLRVRSTFSLGPMDQYH